MSKSIIIFGAGAGISQSVTQTFGKQGFSVALVSRNTEKLQGFFHLIKSFPPCLVFKRQ